MRIHIATDHAGLEFKDKLAVHLGSQGYEVVDHGAYVYNAEDDYPEFIIAAAQAVASDQRDGLDSLGVVFGGSGNGEQMAANKVKGIRAALCHDAYTATVARGHNDANILCFGERIVGKGVAESIVDAWIAGSFDGGRHEQRVAKIEAITN